jgi:restriction system protein
MAVPEFYRFFRVVLEVLRDGQSRHWSEIEAVAADRFHLSVQDREELVPSGQRTRLSDRTQWAITYLRQAGLLETGGRGIAKITDTGRAYLERAPEVITPTALLEFESFAAFQRRSRASPTRSRPPVDQVCAVVPDPPSETPEDRMAVAYDELNTALAQSLLDRVKRMPPAFFERLIVDLMLRLGYGGPMEDAGLVLGRAGDGGVDGVISQDKLGLEKIYLQAKRWDDRVVGRVDVQAFVGALSGQGAAKGVFITTSTFSRDAEEYVNRLKSSIGGSKVSLVDGLGMARLMIETGLGVALVRRYEVKRVDSDFFVDT